MEPKSTTAWRTAAAMASLTAVSLTAIPPPCWGASWHMAAPARERSIRLCQRRDSSGSGGGAIYGGSSQGAINAGNYVITPAGLTSGNYDITYAIGALTINKAALTVTAGNAAKVYDAIAYSGGNGVTYSGLVNGESGSVLGGALTWSGSSQGGKNAGSYIITPVGLTSDNYSITFGNGTLTITPRLLTANGSSLTGGVNKLYDGASTANLATDNYLPSTFSGWVGTDSATITKTSGSYDTASVGSGKTVTVTLTGSDYQPVGGTILTNYILPTTLSGSVGKIDRAQLAVTANNAVRTYNGLAYSGGNGVSYSGFVNGESTAVLSGGLTWSGSSQGAKNAGIYGISPAGLTSGNYDISYASGILTINRGSLTITAINAAKTYDGLAYSCRTAGRRCFSCRNPEERLQSERGSSRLGMDDPSRS